MPSSCTGLAQFYASGASLMSSHEVPLKLQPWKFVSIDFIGILFMDERSPDDI